jgi:hypothetical protein
MVSQLVAIDRSLLTEQAGRIAKQNLRLIFAGIDVVLGRLSGTTCNRDR